jgi:hypothetical protein
MKFSPFNTILLHASLKHRSVLLTEGGRFRSPGLLRPSERRPLDWPGGSGNCQHQKVRPKPPGPDLYIDHHSQISKSMLQVLVEGPANVKHFVSKLACFWRATFVSLKKVAVENWGLSLANGLHRCIKSPSECKVPASPNYPIRVSALNP